MGRFVVHGVLIEEPKRTTTSNGIDCATLIIEEKYKTPFNKEVINLFAVDFTGKAINCIPENTRLVGCVVVVTGMLRGREYNSRYFTDLSGDTLTVINAPAGITIPKQVSEDAKEPEITGTNLDKIEVPQDDDLPF